MEYKDYYKVLGVGKSAGKDELKKQYRILARKYHPDVNTTDKDAGLKFGEISEAYDVLSDEDKRRKYDAFGSDWESIKSGTRRTSTGANTLRREAGRSKGPRTGRASSGKTPAPRNSSGPSSARLSSGKAPGPKGTELRPSSPSAWRKPSTAARRSSTSGRKYPPETQAGNLGRADYPDCRQGRAGVDGAESGDLYITFSI